MFRRWQQELERSEERAQWRGRVDQTLKDLGKQVSAVEASVRHVHDCIETRVTPLMAWQNRLIGVLVFLSVVLPVVLWLLGGWRPGGSAGKP